MKLTRRAFLQVAGATGATLTLAKNAMAFRLLKPAVVVDNPLDTYPDRRWESVYRDQYQYDRTFTYCCSPNDTHACRIRAFVRNNVMMRVEQNYDHQNYTDLYGNQATRNWNPRMCLKGYTFHRRVYGPYRLRYPLIRKGWKRWADDGFPELTPENKSKYMFDNRGNDELLRASWDEAFTYASKGILHITKKYSGPEGAQKLIDQGYPKEMVDRMQGAGTRTFKGRGGMGLLGVIGKYGMYRFNNCLAIVDAHNRGVGPEQALGGRNWSNYTWHGDQAPGHPFSHGLQTSDVDMNDVRFSKLLIQTGKNLIENKMPEAHWVTEVMERGGKIVVITPEYSPSAQKADYWIPIRNNTDTALFLGITKILIDNKWYDADYVKKFTDFPLLVRTDTLKRVSPKDIIPNYKLQDISDGPSYHIQGLKDEQREIIGDFVVWDAKSKGPKAITRDDVGETLVKKGIDPVLEGSFKLKTVDGKEIEVMTLLEMYKIHLRDYDIDSVVDMTNSPKELIERLAKDIATIKPVAIHYGEGVNHYFHATLMNRSYYLPVMLTGNVGYFGSGSHTWAGNYKAGNFQASKWSGPGFYGWVAEDVFKPNLDPYASAKDLNIKGRALDEEVAYWNHSERPLIVNTPKYGRKVFTGKTHMPTPTKIMWFTNVNLINNAKHVYQMLKNVNPNIEQIMSTDIEITGSIEYADFAFPANSWVEFQEFEITTSCSNPFIQIWGKTGITPVYESKDDVKILAGMASKLGELLRDTRFEDNWKFALEGRASVYINRLLDGSTTMKGYTCEDILNGKYGEPGVALMLYRTYPRQPFWEQVHESLPFYTPTGRLQAYNDEPEIIEYGENFIVHREGPEATPYLPNAIVSTNPYIRPDDYGIPESAEHWEDRTVRNIKKSWEETKKTKNFLWEKGYHFYCVTPKSRHTVHSQWAVTDWNFIWNNNFGDPYRMDKRMPGVGEHQIHIHPQAAKDLGIEDGDYVYVDANPADRPYEGWKPNDSFYKVSRLMLRAKYNPAYPYNCTMMKHSAWISSDKTVQAHETRPDGRALSPSGYQSSFRYGSQQSITRDWSMPMHQLDSLFHKAKIGMKFIFGFEADNHCINTVPKETLVKITKAENGGMGGKGVWDPVKTGYTAGNENDFMKKFLNGELIKVDA